MVSLIEKATLLTTVIGYELNYQYIAEGKVILLMGLARSARSLDQGVKRVRHFIRGRYTK
jgi:hypothetical protein